MGANGEIEMTTGDHEARMAYARQIAHAEMTTRELAQAVIAKFGRAPAAEYLRDVLRATGRDMTKRADLAGLNRKGNVSGAAEREAYARSVAKPGMTWRDLEAALQAKFGMAMDTAKLRRVLREKGGKVGARPRVPLNNPAAVQEREAFVRSIAKPGMTATAVRAAVKEKFGVGIDPTRAGRMLREMGIEVRQGGRTSTELATVNHALERAHSLPVLTDSNELDAGIRATMRKLEAQMRRAHITRLALDLTERTYDIEWQKRITGRLGGDD